MQFASIILDAKTFFDLTLKKQLWKVYEFLKPKLEFWKKDSNMLARKKKFIELFFKDSLTFNYIRITLPSTRSLFWLAYSDSSRVIMNYLYSPDAHFAPTHIIFNQR